MSQISKVLKHMSIYSFGVVLGQAVGFVMLPLYTHLLTPGDYGVLELLQMFANVLGVVVGLGISNAVLRFYYLQQDQESRNEVVSTGLAIVVVGFAIVVALALPFSRGLSRVIFGDPTRDGLVRLELIAFALSSLFEVPLTYLRAKQASAEFTALSVARLAVALTLNVVALVVLKLGVVGILYSNIATSMLVGGYLAVGTVRETGFRPSTVMGRRLIVFGAPLILSGLGTFVVTFSDRYFLRVFGTLAQVGLYSLAYKIAAVTPNLLFNPFAQIWGAKMLEIADKPEGRETCRTMFRYYNLVAVVAILGVSLFARDILGIMAAPSFLSAAAVVPVIGLSYLFASYRQFSFVGFWVTAETLPVAKLTAVSAGLNLAGNILLIPRFGMWGAAWATVLAYGVEFLVGMVMSQRRYAVAYDWAAILNPIVGAATAYALVLGLATRVPFPAFLVLKAGVLVLFPVLSVALGAISPRELRTLVALAQNPGRAFRLIYGES